jgi:hypothetical protein
VTDELSQIRLDNVVGRWPISVEENRKALGDGWAVAEEFLRLHARGLQQISRAAGATPCESDKTLMLLGAHGLNLYITTVRLIVGGLFDVAAYLLRASFDCQTLLYATGRDEEVAKRFAAGDLKASQARKRLVADLRQGGQAELAQQISTRFEEEAKAANDLSHLKLIHLDKLIEVGDSSITPVVGGRADSKECLNFWKAALEHEHWILSWFLAFRKPALDSDWIRQYETVRARFLGWFGVAAGL